MIIEEVNAEAKNDQHDESLKKTETREQRVRTQPNETQAPKRKHLKEESDLYKFDGDSLGSNRRSVDGQNYYRRESRDEA